MQNGKLLIVPVESGNMIWHYYQLDNEYYLQGVFSPYVDAKFSTVKIGVGTKQHKALTELLKQRKNEKGEFVGYSNSDMCEILTNTTPQTVKTSFTDLKKSFQISIGATKAQLTLKMLFKKTTSHYAFVHSIIQLKNDHVLNDAMLADISKFEKYRILEQCVSKQDLFDVLTTAFPDIKNHIKHYQDIALPYIEQEPLIFPLQYISDIATDYHRRSNSLFLQKLYQSNLYAGHQYALHKVVDGDAIITDTTYDKALDHNDFLASRLRVYLAEAMQQHHFESILDCVPLLHDVTQPLGRLAQEWYSRFSLVVQGYYQHSAMGISVPIFQKDGQKLKVLGAKMNRQKATGNGVYHVVPSSMFDIIEYKPFIDFRDVLIVVAKEMLKEAFLPKSISMDSNSHFKAILHLLHLTDSYQTLSFELMIEVFKLVEQHWMNIVEDIEEYSRIRSKVKYEILEPFRQVLQAIIYHQPLEHYLVVDMYNLRPEIIIPIYISSDFPVLLNWEFAKKQDNPHWKNREEFQAWLVEHHQDWCSPALAAMVLGVEQFWEYYTVDEV